MLERKRVVRVVVPDFLDLLVEISKHEALVFSGIFGDFNVRPVHSTQKESPTACQLRVLCEGLYILQGELHVTLQCQCKSR